MRVSPEFLISLISLLTRATHLSDRCKVTHGFALASASESSNIDHVTPSPRLQATGRRTPRARAFHLCLACTISSSALCIRRLPPQIAIGSMFSPSQPSRLGRRTPKPSAQAQASPPSHRPTSKRKTPLLYVARVAHRPCPSPLEVGTSSRFRRIAAGYGIAQAHSYAFVIPLLF